MKELKFEPRWSAYYHISRAHQQQLFFLLHWCIAPWICIYVCMSPCNSHPEQDIEHFLHLIKFPLSLSFKTHLLPQVTNIMTSIIVATECLCLPSAPHPIICWNPSSQWDGLRGWGLLEVIHSWEWSYEWFQCSYKRGLRKPPCPSRHVVIVRRRPSVNQEVSAHQMSNPTATWSWASQLQGCRK